MKFERASFSYGRGAVLRDVNLEIRPGEFVFLVGDSGSGKTSLVKALVGDLRPTSGRVLDDAGNDVYAMDGDHMAKHRRAIGIVFQDYKLLRSRTVRENVAFAMEACGYPDSYVVSHVPELLSQMGLLSKVDAFADRLSGGEQQRVAVARALIHDPAAVVADEPTGNLDLRNAREVMSTLERLNAEGKTVVIATHDDRLVDRLGRRVVALHGGRVVHDAVGGYPSKLLVSESN